MGATNFSVYTKFQAKDNVSQVFKNMKNGATSFSNRLNRLTVTTQNFGNKIKGSFDKVNMAVTATVTLFAANTVKQQLDSWVDFASDLQETMGKTEQTFKSNAQAVIEWSKTSISAMGLAQQTALDSAALFGDMGTGMGMTTQRAAEMSTSLVQLSADLASFKNMSQDMTMTALKGIFTGETESLKNLGVVMTQEVLEGYAKAIGLHKKFSDMTQTEKIELRYQYVMNATRNSQGDFQRTGGNYANQSRMFEQQQKELQTRLGNVLLPQYNNIMKSMNQALLRYTPALEKGFENMFKAFQEGLTICKPIFQEFNNMFNYLRANLLPEVISMLPMIKTILETAVVPAITLVLKGVQGLFVVINTGYNVLKGLFSFIKDNWLPILLALPAAIVGVQFAIDTLRLKMALLRMEGGLLSVVMNTKLMTALTSFTAGVWKSVTALLAQAAAFAVSPVGLITIGIMALVGVVILLWKNWDKVTATLVSWWNTASSLLASFWEKCKGVFSSVGTFIKNNFINILLSALGPVGLILNGIIKISQKIRSIKNDSGGIEIKNESDGQPVNNKPRINNDTKNGRIDVGVTVDNKTGYEASSSLELEGKNGLKLQPA